MISADLQKEAYDVLGQSKDELVLRKLTGAIRILGKKGNWDPGLGSMTLAVAATGDIYLPADVETPLRVSVNDQSAQLQDQFYEFDTNRPGDTSGSQVGWTWRQRFPTPLQVALVTPTRLRVAQPGTNVRVTGIDNATGERVESLTLQTDYDGCPTFREIISVSKDVGPVNTYVDVESEEAQGDLAADGLVARYHWRETTPEFRVIRLDGADARPDTIRLLYRRRSYALSTWQDYVPLGSVEAVIFMLRALFEFERGQLEKGEGLQAKALEFLADDQNSREAAGKAAAAEGQKTSISNFGHRFAGVVAAGEVYDDASAIFGALGRERLLDRISDAAELLSRKASWDSLVGYARVTVTPDSSRSAVIVSLPSWMDSVLSVLREGRPTVARSHWIDFHINGPWLEDWVPCDAFDYMEDGPLTAELPTGGARLVCVREDAADSARTVRVEGLDDYGRPQSIDYPLLSEPVTVPGDYPGTTWSRIDRVAKSAAGAGYVRVHVRGTSPVLGTQLSEMRPSEREARFRRIRVSAQTTLIAVMFRRRSARAANLDDFFPLRSREAIVDMMRSMAAGDPKMEGYDPKLADYHDEKAVRLLSEEQKSTKPALTIRFQSDDEMMAGQHFID